MTRPPVDYLLLIAIALLATCMGDAFIYTSQSVIVRRASEPRDPRYAARRPDCPCEQLPKFGVIAKSLTRSKA